MINDRDKYQASTHYVWRMDPCDLLGEGAFGAVYRGFHKETCEPVAVKTFNKMALKRPHTVQMRELSILEKLDHPNVVKLIAVEEIISSQRSQPCRQTGCEAASLDGRVLVMELCTEGSLYSIIEQSENRFGLEEMELMRVLRHTTSGMKYLRENKIVHRDWKPSNVLKTVLESGRVLYKLCDFGAARELDDNQTFLSIVGTEEYIPPEIYGRALLGHSHKSFFATSELWSFGVTLYHVATGQLPFRPFGGRRNRDTMYRIISSKEPGVVSGVQHEENGPIAWSKSLPTHCRLSRQCQRFLTHLLANVLETDRQKAWNFEKFFAYVEDFLQKVCLRCVSATLHSEFIYLDKTAKWQDVVECATQSMRLDQSKRALFWSDRFAFFDETTCDESVAKLLACSADCLPRSLLCFDSQSSFVPPSLSPLKLPADIIFTDEEDLSSDYDLANMCTALAFWIAHAAKQRTDCANMFNEASFSMINWLEINLRSLQRRMRLVESLAAHRLSLDSSNESLEKTYVSIKCDVRRVAETLSLIEKLLATWQPSVASSHDSSSIMAIDGSIFTMLDIVAQFRNDKVLARTSGNLSNNEIKWHKLQKRALKRTWESVCSSSLDGNAMNHNDVSKLIDFLNSTRDCHATLRECESNFDLSNEEMHLWLQTSFQQDPCGQQLELRPQRDVELSALVNETMKQIQDLRLLARKNREIFPPFLVN